VTYPNGIPGDNGADITASFTTKSARDLATQLRLGALPIRLHLISAKRLTVRG
jgi:preprotein translocase subunit SecD